MGIQNDGQPEGAALTPRPRRLLLIGRISQGTEGVVREAQASFPVEAAAEAGIGAVEAFVGSGFYAVWLEIDQDDVQAVMAAYLNDPRVRAFHTKLQPVVEGLPGPGWVFATADRFHEETSATESPPGPLYGTSDLPLAASMYRWRAGSPPMIGDEPVGGGLLDER